MTDEEKRDRQNAYNAKWRERRKAGPSKPQKFPSLVDAVLKQQKKDKAERDSVGGKVATLEQRWAALRAERESGTRRDMNAAMRRLVNKFGLERAREIVR